MAAGGDAIARIADGRVVFVRGRCPTSWWRSRSCSRRRTSLAPRCVEVVEPSAHRVAPPCPAHAAGCGGCTWQHVDRGRAVGSEDGRRDRGAEADRQAHRPGRRSRRVACRRGPIARRLRLATGDDRLGLRGRHSHDVVELDGCPVSHPLLQDLLAVIRVRGQGEVSLRVSAATGETIGMGRRRRRGAARTCRPMSAIGPTARGARGRRRLRLRVSAASFFQSGPAAAELLVAAVREACGDVRRVRTPSSMRTAASGCSPLPSTAPM